MQGSPNSADSSALDELSGALRRLHKALLDAEAENFGPISGPFQFLNLVTHHEHFAWLRSLSELMVELDELRESDDSVDSTQVGALRATVEGLVGSHASSPPQFQARYVALLQQSPTVAMAHGDLRRVLGKLPNTSESSAP